MEPKASIEEAMATLFELPILGKKGSLNYFHSFRRNSCISLFANPNISMIPLFKPDPNRSDGFFFLFDKMKMKQLLSPQLQRKLSHNIASNQLSLRLMMKSRLLSSDALCCVFPRKKQ